MPWFLNWFVQPPLIEKNENKQKKTYISTQKLHLHAPARTTNLDPDRIMNSWLMLKKKTLEHIKKMPQSDGGYVSLTGGGPHSVYNSTTEPQSASKSVMETVKRVIGTAIGAQDKHSLLERDSTGMQPYIISSR